MNLYVLYPMIKSKIKAFLKASFCFILLLFFCFSSSAGQNAVNTKIIARGDWAYPPFEFINDKGEPDGFNVELFKALMQELGMEYDLQLIHWGDAMELLKNKKIDAITGMAYSSMRARQYSFSIPHSFLTQNIICRKNHPVNTLEELHNKDVILQTHEITNEVLFSTGTNCHVIPTDNMYQGLELLSGGEYDAAICGDILAKFIIRKYHLNNLEIRYLPAIRPISYCLAAHIDNPQLSALFNQGLEKLKVSGIYNRIYNKWFLYYQQPESPVKIYIILGILALITLISLIIIHVIRRHIRSVTRELNLLNDEMSETLLRTHLAIKKSKLTQWDYDCQTQALYTTDNFRPGGTLVSGLSPLSNIHPKDTAKISAIIERMKNREDFEYTVDVKMRYPGKEGWQYVSIDGIPVKDPYGRVIKYTGFCRNNTGLVTLNNRIKEQNIYLNMALQSGNIIPMIIDPENNMCQLSSRMLRYGNATGIPSGGIPLEKILLHIHPEDREEVRSLFQEVKEGEIRKITHEIRYYDHEWMMGYLELNYTGRDFDPQGKPRKIVGYFQNITKRKQAEEELKQQKEFVSNILDLLPIPIHIKDLDDKGVYLYWNKESEKFFGDMLYKSTVDLVDENQAEEIIEIDREVYRTGMPYISQEHLVTRAGKEFNTIVHKNVIYNGSRKLLLVARWDIKEQLELYRRSKLLSSSMKALRAYTWHCDLRDGILRFGDGFEQTEGCAEEMNSLFKFAQKIHPLQREQFLRFMTDFCKQESGNFAIEYEIDYIGSGKYEWWECRGVIETETNHNASYKYISGMDINISKHKEIELALTHTKTKLAGLNKQTQLILNNTNSGLVFIDNNYVVQWENLAEYLPGHSMTAHYQTGIVCHKVIQGLDAPCPECIVAKSQQTGLREFKELHMDGITTELMATPVYDENNKWLGSVLKVVNITEKQKITRELEKAKNKAEESNKLMQGIYDRLPCLLFIKDVTDNYRYMVANNYFCSALGKPGSEIVGKTDFEIFPQAEAEKFRRDDTAAAAMEYPYTFEEDTWWQGKHIVWQTTKSVMDAINGHKIMICLSLDITDKIASYKELQAAKEKAEQSNKLKSAFLANMSHEIRTPLNAIVGFSNLMAYSDDNEEKKDYYNIINTNNELLLRLIGDILDLSKIEAGMLELKPEEFNIEELFHNLNYTFSQRITSPDVRLICETPGEDHVIYLDKNRFTQVITNFVNNAIKFTPGGEIKIGYRKEAGGIKIYVADTGIGIAPDKIEKVFERFEKLDDFAQGTGLGMAICKAIMDAFGGTIGVESEVGSGSVFWACFPLTHRISE